MKPIAYVVILVVMFAFLLLSPFKWLVAVVGILFVVSTLIRYLFWRNQFDWE